MLETPDAGIEQRLDQLLGAVTALSERVDEYRVRSRSEVANVLEVSTALGRAVEVLLREQHSLADAAGLDRLTEATRALRDDLAEAHRQSREEAERLRTTLDGRQVVLSEALDRFREESRSLVERVEALPTELAAPPPPPPADDAPVREALQELRADVQRLQGELLAAVSDPASLQGIYDRLGGIEWRLGERLDPLDGRLQELERRLGEPVAPADPRVLDRLVALESAIEQLVQRDDLRRGVDRVLGAVSGAEQLLAGEVRAVDARVGAIADEVRVVRVLRDGLEGLAHGVDGIRQLAARSATSQQMTEVTRELGAVLAEIERARSQVLRVEQSSSPVAADVVAVGSDVDQLGKRIDELADALAARTQSGPAGPEEIQAVHQVTQRLRHVSSSARSLGNGVLDDLRARQRRRR